MTLGVAYLAVHVTDRGIGGPFKEKDTLPAL